MKRIYIPKIALAFLVVQCMVMTETALAVSLAPSQTETQSYALIVGTEPNGQSKRLAQLLEQQYGFKVAALFGEQATRANIDEAMFKIAESVGPYDQLFVFISLPILRDPNLYYLPSDANPRERWQHLSWDELQRWLISLEVGSTLLSYPTCQLNSNSASSEPGIDSLTYRIGKRRSPIELLLICDSETIRTARREPEESFRRWRGDEVAGKVYRQLQGEIQTRGESNLVTVELDAVSLLRAISSRSNIKLRHYTVPLYQKPQFRFVPIEKENAYEARYSNARNYDSLSDVFMDYQSASNKNDSLQLSFIAFAGKVAVQADAATSLDLSEREVYQIRRNAVSALKQRAKSDAARDELNKIALNASDSAAIRRTAVASLGASPENSRASDLLAFKAAIGDTDATVREAAYVALAQSSDADAATILTNAFATETSASARRVILLALPKFGRIEDANLYIEALKDENSGVRTQAVAAFSSLPPSGEITIHLANHFEKETDVRVLTTLVYALGYSLTPDEKELVTNLLIEGLELHHDKNIRVAIATVLGDIGSLDTTAALIGLLGEMETADVASAAAKSLGKLKATSAVPQLSELVMDRRMEVERPLVVVAAIWALGQINSPEAAKPLWQKLESADDLRIREAAQTALADMTFDPDTIKEKLTNKSYLVRESAIAQASKSSHPDAQKILLEGLNDDDSQVQEASVSGLAAGKISNLVQPIEDAYEKGSTRVKVNLIKALGKTSEMDSAWIIKKLVDATESRSLEVRVAAIESLGALNNEQSSEALIRSSYDNNEVIRNAAVVALGNHDSVAAQERLKQIVRESKVRNVRNSALESINRQQQIERIEKFETIKNR